MTKDNSKEEQELNEQSGKFIGELQQAMIDALNERANEIFAKEHLDRAYWEFDITLVMREIDATLTQTLHTTIIESKNVY